MGYKSKNKNRTKSLPTLDLHGFKQDEVFDALDQFLLDASAAAHAKARVMTGKGKGIVAAEAKKYLKAGGYPYVLEKMENGQVNEGVLVVILD